MSKTPRISKNEHGHYAVAHRDSLFFAYERADAIELDGFLCNIRTLDRFNAYCKIEPALRALEYECKKNADAADCSKSYCANDFFYRQIKPKLIYLVGDLRSHPELGTSEAYGVCYEYLYSLLGSCRNCGCWGNNQEEPE